MLSLKSIDVSRRSTLSPRGQSSSDFSSPIRTVIESQIVYSTKFRRIADLSDLLIGLKHRHGYPCCFDQDGHVIAVGTSLGHVMIFDVSENYNFLFAVDLDEPKIRAHEDLTGFGACISIQLFTKAESFCVGFLNGCVILCYYRKTGDEKFFMLQTHHNAVINLIRLSGELSSTPLFFSCDSKGEVHLNIKHHRKGLMSSCIASAKDQNNSVLGIASTRRGRTRLVVLIYSNRVS